MTPCTPVSKHIQLPNADIPVYHGCILVGKEKG